MASQPIPVYPASAKVPSAVIRRTVRTVLDTLGEVPDPLPGDVRDRHGLVGLRRAFDLVHRPTAMADTHTGRRRLRFEEAFVLQVALQRRRATTGSTRASSRPPRRTWSNRRPPANSLDQYESSRLSMRTSLPVCGAPTKRSPPSEMPTWWT